MFPIIDWELEYMFYMFSMLQFCIRTNLKETHDVILSVKEKLANHQHTGTWGRCFRLQEGHRRDHVVHDDLLHRKWIPPPFMMDQKERMLISSAKGSQCVHQPVHQLYEDVGKVVMIGNQKGCESAKEVIQFIRSNDGNP